MTGVVATEVRELASTNGFVRATLVDRPRDYRVEGRAVVVNHTRTPVGLGERGFVPAFSSTVLVDTTIERAESVLLFSVTDPDGIVGIVGEPGWHPLADLLPGFPVDTPLWRGPQDDIGTLTFDPAPVLGEDPSPQRTFRVKVNLWFAPAGTDCGLHDRHDFIEIHSQVAGRGRMQKFTARDHAALYEDLLMSPGHTPPVPFCRTGPDGGFVYPWHQYRADTDCVWLAVEYH